MLERTLVPHVARCAAHAGELAAGIQLRAAAQRTGLHDAGGVPADTGLWKRRRQGRLGKHKPFSTFPASRRGRRATLEAKPKPRISSYEWLRESGQVTPTVSLSYNHL